MLELIYNKIYMLKKANNLRKMPKIKVFIEKKWRKMSLKDWNLSALIWNLGCRIFLTCEYRKRLLHESKPCWNSLVTPSLLSLAFVHCMGLSLLLLFDQRMLQYKSSSPIIDGKDACWDRLGASNTWTTLINTNDRLFHVQICSK